MESDMKISHLQENTVASMPRDDTQAEVSKQVAVEYASEDGTKTDVLSVYFTEFVMQ